MRRAALICLLLSGLPARAEPLRVVADIPVTAALSQAVLGDAGAPGILLDAGSDPHHAQLRPSQARLLASADLVLMVGPELTPGLAASIARLGDGAETVELLRLPGVDLHGFGEAADHEPRDDHDHGPSDDAVDPHAWLDPANAAAMVTGIGAALAARDPENADLYTDRAAGRADAIRALGATLDARLAPYRGRPFVVFHDAYGYFARAFGLEIAGSIALGDARDPGARRMAELRETIETQGVACIFREPQHNPALAERIAEDTGARLGLLDPLGTALEPGPDLYERLMTEMADSVADCLDG